MRTKAFIGAVAASLPPEVVAVAQERGRGRDLDATVAELLAEMSGDCAVIPGKEK